MGVAFILNHSHILLNHSGLQNNREQRIALVTREGKSRSPRFRLCSPKIRQKQYASSAG